MKYILIVTTLFSISVFGQKNNETVLDSIKMLAKKTNSSTISIYLNGKPILQEVYEEDFKPQNIMSATKSIAGLAIGILLKENKIKTVDMPLYEIFKERDDWKTGFKKEITIRHILTHTSGLETVPTIKIYESGDCVQFALNSTVKVKPGTEWKYNNNAINLVSGIVKQLTGKSMVNYLQEKLFTPLEINNVYWVSDVHMKALTETWKNKTTLTEKEEYNLMTQGNSLAMDGLLISSNDLVKIGQLLLNDGKVGKKSIIDKNWIKISTAKLELFPKYGFSWWLIPDPKNSYVAIEQINIDKIKKINDDNSLHSILKECLGKKFVDLDKVYDDLDKLCLKYNYNIENFYTIPVTTLATDHVNGIIGFYADGSNGNRLFIFPEKKIVAARTISQSQHKGMHDGIHDNFVQLYNLLQELD